MRLRGFIVAVAATTVALAALIAALFALRASSHRPAAGQAPVSAAVPDGVAQAQPTPQRVLAAFGAGYGEFLDGGPLSALRFASLTERAQAQSAGRIPAGFRDGAVRLVSVSSSAGPYSAQATLVLSNREERYPFAVQLLRERHGWEVAQLQPPDLTIDEHTAPVTAVHIPAGAQAATRRFALAYAAFRAGLAARPPAMAPAAAKAIAAGQDTLADVQLPRAAPRLESVKYGPLVGGELAATATVRFAATTQQFSLLMQLRKQTGGWLCAAFL